MSRAPLLHRCRCALALVALATLPVLALPTASGAADTDTTVARAVSWLRTQQQPDGGFEVAGFGGGFETRDAALAIAEAAQASEGWSTTEAQTAVEAVRRDGHSAVDALEVAAASTQPALTAGGAAKLIVLTAVPLGIRSDAFGSTDLTQVLRAGAQPDGTYGHFNDTLWAALAEHLLSGSVPPTTIDAILAAQQAGGGWAADPGFDVDIDTTGVAIQVLAAATPSGADAGIDAAIGRGLAYLAAQHGTDGSWASFGAADPNSTAVAMLAVRAAGYDPSGSCWRDTFAPTAAGTSYVDPAEYLRGQQTPDGRIASPNDSFGVNTFATSQSVEALLGSWLPIARRDLVACTPPTPTTTTTAPVAVEAATAAAVTAEDGGTVGGELPRTGAPLATTAELGVALLGSGLLLARRRRA